MHGPIEAIVGPLEKYGRRRGKSMWSELPSEVSRKATSIWLWHRIPSISPLTSVRLVPFLDYANSEGRNPHLQKHYATRRISEAAMKGMLDPVFEEKSWPSRGQADFQSIENRNDCRPLRHQWHYFEERPRAFAQGPDCHL